jgi:hypothetical protein
MNNPLTSACALDMIPGFLIISAIAHCIVVVAVSIPAPI